MQVIQIKEEMLEVHRNGNGACLPLMEHFYTLQGEGYHSGRAAYFIRLAGCDVGCVWCDVKESWNAEEYPLVQVSELASLIADSPSEIAVVTGGEPLMYDLDPLCKALGAKKIERFIETSGAYPLSGSWDWVCVSPKKFKSPLPEVLQAANELKTIIYNRSDFQWAEKHAALVNKECKLYLQPEWSKREEMMPLIVDYIKNNPRWQVSLQTHKYMDIP